MIFDIRSFGAVGNGKTFDTEAIQAAIDACSAAGGGQVLAEGGTFLTAPIRLKSYVELHLDSSAVLLGSPRTEDYKSWEDTETIDADMLPRHSAASLIFAENCHHISLTGTGTIDANGTYFVKPDNPANPDIGWKSFVRLNMQTPPRVVFFASCRKVRISDITLQNGPAGWNFFIHNCDDVCISRVTLDNDLRYHNNDGLHINSSRDVTVSDCNITASDDAIIVRANNSSLKENKVCERITVTNCNIISHCGGIRLGWIRDGVIRNCVFSNLTMTNPRTGIHVTTPWRGPDRIPDEGREKLLIENIIFDNITMDRIYGNPVRFYLDDHENTRADIEAIRNICFRAIRARGLYWPSIEGRPGTPIEGLEFSDCRFEKEERTPEYDPYTKYVPKEKPEQIGTELMYCVKDCRMNNTVFTGK